jgi:hypothetical protein
MTHEQQRALAGLGPVIAAGLRWLLGLLVLGIANVVVIDLALVDVGGIKMSAEQFAYLMAGCAAVLWGTKR